MRKPRDSIGMRSAARTSDRPTALRRMAAVDVNGELSGWRYGKSHTPGRSGKRRRERRLARRLARLNREVPA